jgi:pimeloyl-ACP methyl ester carboxylesterase
LHSVDSFQRDRLACGTVVAEEVTVPRALTMVAWLAGAGAAGYALIAVAAFFGQRSLMYPVPAFPVEPHVAGAELVRMIGPEGAAVFALHAPPPPGAPTVVHFHGNGEDLGGQAWLVDALSRRGLGVLAVEYPGYGPSRGATLGEDAIYAAAETALRYLAERGVAQQSIVLQGQSLGSGVAVEMARRGYGARLILIAPYTSMVDMARLVLPFLPVRWLVRDRYESDRKAPGISLPALVIHGTKDEVIPFRMGRRMAELLPHAELFPVSEAHHNDLFLDDAVAVVAKIAAFAQGARRAGE